MFNLDDESNYEFNKAELAHTADDVNYEWPLYMYYLVKIKDKNKGYLVYGKSLIKLIVNSNLILFAGLPEYAKMRADEYINNVGKNVAASNDDAYINKFKNMMLSRKFTLMSSTLDHINLSITHANSKQWADVMLAVKPYDLYIVFYSYPGEAFYHTVIYMEYENAEKLFNSLVKRFGDEKYVKTMYGKEYYIKNENIKDSDFTAVFSYVEANPKTDGSNFKDFVKYTIGSTVKLND